MYVGEEMFRSGVDPERAREIFAQTVVRVEVETHSYCNRRCSYCPNVIGDRLGPNERIAPDLWERILSDLEEIGYGQQLILNNYNEPLFDRTILDRIREARARLPRARIMIYSNGDYLTPEYVQELADAGLSYLHISIHLKRDDEYSDLYVVNRMIEISVRMGIPVQLKRIKTTEFAYATAPHPSMEIEVRAINFYKRGTDRGGLIPEIHTEAGRTAPCYFPFVHFLVGFNGTVVPCCHVRSDRPEHKDFTYGSLRDYPSIFEAFMGQVATAWRREVSTDLPKRAPCDTCAGGRLDNKGDEARFPGIAERKRAIADEKMMAIASVRQLPAEG